jgi:hypothetical protein
MHFIFKKLQEDARMVKVLECFLMWVHVSFFAFFATIRTIAQMEKNLSKHEALQGKLMQGASLLFSSYFCDLKFFKKTQN